MQTLADFLPSYPIAPEYLERHERAKVTLPELLKAFYQKHPDGDHLNNDEIREAAFWVGIGHWPTEFQREVVEAKRIHGNSRPDIYAGIRREKAELQGKIDRGEIKPGRRRRRVAVRFDERD